MRADELHRSLDVLFGELVDGARAGGGFTLNRGDAGLLRSLDRLSPAAASRSLNGGATIAAHVDHLRYGFSLMNRWAAGENPFADADWSVAWRTSVVNAADWDRLRRELREQVESWRTALRSPRELSGTDLDIVIGEVTHLAYHLGAMRQIAPEMRGPKASP